MRDIVRNQCLRKLRHLDFLSAIKHAASLADRTLRAYLCPHCGATHIGHDRTSSATSTAVPNRIWRTERKIERLLRQVERGYVNPRPKTLERANQRLSDLRRHLCMLRKELQSRGQNDDTAISARQNDEYGSRRL